MVPWDGPFTINNGVGVGSRKWVQMILCTVGQAEAEKGRIPFRASVLRGLNGIVVSQVQVGPTGKRGGRR